MMKIGLTLGKFAPLHRGHQLVIETALQEMEKLVVLIYDSPEIATHPLPVRSQWIRNLYPSVEVVEAWDGPRETGLASHITAQHDAYLQRMVGDKGITHFYSSEPYGHHVSLALKCHNRQVDAHRQSIAISATTIRADPFNHRHFLAPCVYSDYVTQVVFLGAPSTGKTTLSQALSKYFHTTWMPEYGREYWEKHQSERRLTPFQLLEIAQEHRRREETLLRDANRYLFIDTDASTTLQFSLYYHGMAEPELWRLANEARDRYDLFFLCEPDIPYEDTWDRSGDASRAEMDRRIEADLMARRIPFTRLHGGLESRMSTVLSVLANHSKLH